MPPSLDPPPGARTRIRNAAAMQAFAARATVRAPPMTPRRAALLDLEARHEAGRDVGTCRHEVDAVKMSRALRDLRSAEKRRAVATAARRRPRQRRAVVQAPRLPAAIFSSACAAAIDTPCARVHPAVK
jgi:hypothetical protein